MYARLAARYLAAFLLLVLLASTTEVLARGRGGRSSGGSVSVHGYYRKDGTYVRPHQRTAPDGNPYNNYSFPGNYNPNTGQITGGNPDTYLERYYNRAPAMAAPAPASPAVLPLIAPVPATAPTAPPTRAPAPTPVIPPPAVASPFVAGGKVVTSAAPTSTAVPQSMVPPASGAFVEPERSHRLSLISLDALDRLGPQPLDGRP